MATPPKKEPHENPGEPNGNRPTPPPAPDAEVWSGGLHWALKEGYRPADTLDGVRQELRLWLENLDELIGALGPKATVGDVLTAAGDPEAWAPEDTGEAEDE